jgi:hypothetical protein
MLESTVEFAKIDWKKTFPWVRLFRVFRTAIDLRMLLLGCVAVVLLSTGDAVLSHLPSAPPREKLDTLFGWDERPAGVAAFALPEATLRNPWRALLIAEADWGVVLRPVQTVVSPVHTILHANATWSQKFFAWTRLAWVLCVWAVVAGAMCRIAAVEQARDTKISLLSAVKYSLWNFPAYMTATLLPVAGIGLFWILCIVGGLLGRIPHVGAPLLGLLWGLELVFGFVMAMILIGAAAGWPLMYATISTEASDGFDGFSRAYSYVFSRPWHYAWFAIVALAYGAVVITFVYFVATLVAYLSAAGVSSSLGTTGTNGLLLGAPDSVGGPGLLNGSPSGTLNVGTFFAGMWLQAMGLLVSGFVASYFWTAVTVIYLLLRQVDDATDFHEVAVPEEKETDDLLPLVGVAASAQPVIERPPAGDFAKPPAVRTVRSPDGHL